METAESPKEWEHGLEEADEWVEEREQCECGEMVDDESPGAAQRPPSVLAAKRAPSLFRAPRSSDARRGNPDFEAYYIAQGICSGGTAWSDFLARCLSPLPLTLKLLDVPGTPGPTAVAAALAARVAGAEAASRVELGEATYQRLGASVPELRKLPSTWPEDHWFEVSAPGGKPWHLPGSLRWFLFAGEQAGLLRTQELASALPVLVADISPRLALDLCAAPGSKTLGMLEKMRKEAGCEDFGILLANEVHPRRADALRDRARRHPLAASHLMICSCDAAKLPRLQRAEIAERPSQPTCDGGSSLRHELGTLINYYRLRSQSHTSKADDTTTEGQKGAKGANKWWRLHRAQFDLVLADVPCSADGTVRKTPDLWSCWSASQGLALFPKQLAILRRGLELLAPGGQLVYSTCTFDPVQCEAVVAAALQIHNSQYGTEVCLESPDAKLPASLAASLRPGLCKWAVPAPNFAAERPHLFREWTTVPDALQKQKGARIRREMFSDFAGSAAAECRHCRRVLPSAELDTGGFFLATFRKSTKACGTSKFGVAPRRHPFMRKAVKTVNGLNPGKGCILKFFGLFDDEADAAAHGVERFPLERLGVASPGQDSLVLLASAAMPLHLQPREGLIRVLGGGLPLLRRMRAAGSAGGFFEGEPPGRVFCWRPALEGAEVLGRCCSRRLVGLPRLLLLRLLEERRLPLPEACALGTHLVGCSAWGDHAKGYIVPGGAIAGLAAETPGGSIGPPFFPVLLSESMILLLASLDVRRLRAELFRA